MCDPITLIGLALGGVSSMMMAGQAMQEPPAAEAPAVPAPESPTEVADVKLGTKDEPADDDRIVPIRKSGNSLGNLGRSSLTI